MTHFSIQLEKLNQTVEILQEKQLDAWMTFVRETSHNADPALGLIVGMNLTWQSAFIITRTGEKIAIVGRYDAENVGRIGGFTEIIGYDQSIQPELQRILKRLNPRQIALNYSENDSAADGLSHGMYLILKRYLQGTSYELISAEGILNSLRGRKSATEIARIRQAVKLTEEIIDQITTYLRPGLHEREIAAFIHAEMSKRGLTPAWEPEYCPIVNCGPDSPIGHAAPSEKYVSQVGQLVHVDLGVYFEDYVSDMQRVWYLQPASETNVPQPILDGFKVVSGAIQAAAAVMKPGVTGNAVDTAARQHIIQNGYPEFLHATGHQIGRTVHDGSTLLGPMWEKYGQSPMGLLEVGNAYTLELGVQVPHYGLVALEEDVIVTENGMEWLATPQTEPIIVRV
ncbi:MAG: aminopeptidase P family protein [Chloroflexi bacterium]|nr:aminopeptidase P family protein [Chloroflexota bacterium]